MAKYRFEQIAINSTEKKKPVEEDRFTYLGLEHLDSGSLKVTRFGSEVAPIGEKLVMHKGDVLFGKRRAYQKKVAIAPFDGIFSAHGMVLRPREDVIDKSFFPLFISSDYFLDAAIKISVGSLSPTINWRDLKTLEFALPDLATQRKLAETLWSINDTMEAYKKLISATDELVKSQFMEQFGDPVANPKGWIVSSIKDVTNKIGSGATPKGGNSVYIAGGVSLIRSMNVYNGYFEPDDLAHISTDHAKLLDGVALQKDDVLLNITGASVARCCIVPEDVLPARVNQHVCILRCDISNVLPTFLNQQLITSQYQKVLWSVAEAGGGTRQAITKQQIENFRIILPPLALQEQFAAFVRQSDKSKLLISRLKEFILMGYRGQGKM